MGTIETAELSSIDLRLEHTRQKDKAVERSLLMSIMERGIEDPLQVATEGAGRLVLLDGFKRYRCARAIGLSVVGVVRIGENVADGLLTLLRRDKSGGLTVLEQAGMIEELYGSHKLSIYEIAQRLGHCVSWVSMRLGLTESMSALVRDRILSGGFPARAYLYGLKEFTRVNNISAQRVDAFVEALSGKGLSTRELFVLSRAYFGGGSLVQQLIAQGQPRRALQLLSGRTAERIESALDDSQRCLVQDLQAVAVGMERVIYHGEQVSWDNLEFSQVVNLSCETIRKRLRGFGDVLRGLYDRSGPAGGGQALARAGGEPETDRTAAAHGCEDRSGDPAG